MIRAWTGKPIKKEKDYAIIWSSDFRDTEKEEKRLVMRFFKEMTWIVQNAEAKTYQLRDVLTEWKRASTVVINGAM